MFVNLHFYWKSRIVHKIIYTVKSDITDKQPWRLRLIKYYIIYKYIAWTVFWKVIFEEER